jgi:hypothetical protein
MKAVTRDIIVGVVAGLVAVGVLSHRDRPQVPPGVYQATLDTPKYRELEEMLCTPGDSNAAFAKLRTGINAPDVKGAALDKIITFVEDASGVEISVDWGLLAAEQIPRTTPVNVRLSGVTAADVLRDALDFAAAGKKLLAWRIESGRVRVSTYMALSEERITRVYDVSDIVRDLYEHDRALFALKTPPSPTSSPEVLSVSKPPARSGARASALLQFADFATTPREIRDALALFLAREVNPESYAHGPSGTIYVWGGKFVAKHPRPQQDQIALWLHWIREDLRQQSTAR